MVSAPSNVAIKSELEVPSTESSASLNILIVAFGKLVAVSVPSTSPMVSAAAVITVVTFPDRFVSKLDCVTPLAKVPLSLIKVPPKTWEKSIALIPTLTLVRATAKSLAAGVPLAEFVT